MEVVQEEEEEIVHEDNEWGEEIDFKHTGVVLDRCFCPMH